MRERCCLLMVLGWALVSAGAVHSIENEWLKITADEKNGAFEIRPKQGLTAAALKGILPEEGKGLKVETTEHPMLGLGQALTGKGCALILYPKLPFVVIAGELHNASDKETVLNRVPLMPLSVDMGTRTEELVMYGTGTPPVAMAPLTNRQASAAAGEGSYVWLALAEPMSRNGVVAGWLTHDRSSGVIFTDVTNGTVRIKPRADYGRLALPPGKSASMELFAVGLFEDARLGLEAFADAMATIYKIKLPPQPSGHCTWYHGRASNEKALPPLAEFAQKELLPFGYEFIQIDDGWQRGVARNGPAKDFSGYRSPGPYGTEGMKGAADMLKRNGFTPGLWLIPFAGTWDAPEFEKRQHWFVKRDDNKPYVVKWGGSCLDMTHPEVQSYLHDIVKRIVHEWGYTYLKLDGLWTGLATGMLYVNDKYREDNLGNAVFHDPKQTNVEAYRKGLKIVREAAGEKTYILGCNVSQNMRTFGASIGLVDAMRVGPDNDFQWFLRGEYRLLAGVRTGTRNYFMHRRVWHNDPDPVYVRASVPTEHARLICSWAALAGQLTVASENLQKLPPDRLDMLRRIMPAHQATARPVDFFEEPLARIWLVTDTKTKVRRDVVGLFNWDDADYIFNYSLKRAGLDAASYVAFDFWENRLVEAVREKFTFKLPPQTCRVLALRPEAEHPQLLSTSRHVTQGMIDVVEEQWDAKTASLSGVSRVVANDRYELRIVLPVAGSLTVGPVNVSKDDQEAGVTISAAAPEGRLLRVVINAPTSRAVAWHVDFK